MSLDTTDLIRFIQEFRSNTATKDNPDGMRFGQWLLNMITNETDYIGEKQILRKLRYIEDYDLVQLIKQDQEIKRKLFK